MWRPVFRSQPERANRAIVGVSMGGFGAVKLALRHPDLFAFAGGLSSALDVPSRPFSISRIGQYRHSSLDLRTRGTAQRRRDNDPFVLASSADPREAPYFLSDLRRQGRLAGDQSQLRQLLEERHFRLRISCGGTAAMTGNSGMRGLDDCIQQPFRSPGHKMMLPTL